MAKIGYARVSTLDQDPQGQVERLKAAGCTRIYVDHGASGAKASRPEWDKCLERLEPGDVLVATKLDRFGRSSKHLIDLAEDFKRRGVQLRCLDQPIDTTSALGEMFFTILAAFAQFERSLIVERTREGLAATAKRGRDGGRKRRLTPPQVELARKLHAEGQSLAQIGELLGNGRPIGKTVVWRALHETAE